MSSPSLKNYTTVKRPKENNTKPRFVWPIHPQYLFWGFAITLLYMGYHEYGTPHLRFVYQYSNHNGLYYYHRCDYVGQYPQSYFPVNGQCPLFKFFNKRGK